MHVIFLTTNFSVLYISNLLDYESLAHFNRTFKKITGTTPAAYRKSTNQETFCP